MKGGLRPQHREELNMDTTQTDEKQTFREVSIALTPQMLARLEACGRALGGSAAWFAGTALEIAAMADAEGTPGKPTLSWAPIRDAELRFSASGYVLESAERHAARLGVSLDEFIRTALENDYQVRGHGDAPL
jgi:hypothetical protein